MWAILRGWRTRIKMLLRIKESPRSTKWEVIVFRFNNNLYQSYNMKKIVFNNSAFENQKFLTKDQIRRNKTKEYIVRNY